MKKKKEAKKNVGRIWKTEGVSHIQPRQASNKLINPIFKNMLYSTSRTNSILYKYYRIYSQICIAISGRVNFANAAYFMVNTF